MSQTQGDCVYLVRGNCCSWVCNSWNKPFAPQINNGTELVYVKLERINTCQS